MRPASGRLCAIRAFNKALFPVSAMNMMPSYATGVVDALWRGQVLIGRAVRRQLMGSRRSGRTARDERHDRAEHGTRPRPRPRGVPD